MDDSYVLGNWYEWEWVPGDPPMQGRLIKMDNLFGHMDLPQFNPNIHVVYLSKLSPIDQPYPDQELPKYLRSDFPIEERVKYSMSDVPQHLR